MPLLEKKYSMTSNFKVAKIACLADVAVSVIQLLGVLRAKVVRGL